MAYKTRREVRALPSGILVPQGTVVEIEPVMVWEWGLPSPLMRRVIKGPLEGLVIPITELEEVCMPREHSGDCLERLQTWRAMAAAYAKAWPHHCRTCGGWGGFGDTYKPAPGPGWLEDWDPCPICADKGLCPRCGAVILTEAQAEEGQEFRICPTCGWDQAQPKGYPPVPECICWDKDPNDYLSEYMAWLEAWATQRPPGPGRAAMARRITEGLPPGYLRRAWSVVCPGCGDEALYVGTVYIEGRVRAYKDTAAYMLRHMEGWAQRMGLWLCPDCLADYEEANNSGATEWDRTLQRQLVERLEAAKVKETEARACSLGPEEA